MFGSIPIICSIRTSEPTMSKPFGDTAFLTGKMLPNATKKPKANNQFFAFFYQTENTEAQKKNLSYFAFLCASVFSVVNLLFFKFRRARGSFEKAWNIQYFVLRLLRFNTLILRKSIEWDYFLAINRKLKFKPPKKMDSAAGSNALIAMNLILYQ